MFGENKYILLLALCLLALTPANTLGGVDDNEKADGFAPDRSTTGADELGERNRARTDEGKCTKRVDSQLQDLVINGVEGENIEDLCAKCCAEEHFAYWWADDTKPGCHCTTHLLYPNSYDRLGNKGFKLNTDKDRCLDIGQRYSNKLELINTKGQRDCELCCFSKGFYIGRLDAQNNCVCGWWEEDSSANIIDGVDDNEEGDVSSLDESTTEANELAEQNRAGTDEGKCTERVNSQLARKNPQDVKTKNTLLVKLCGVCCTVEAFAYFRTDEDCVCSTVRFASDSDESTRKANKFEIIHANKACSLEYLDSDERDSENFRSICQDCCASRRSFGWVDSQENCICSRWHQI